MRDNGGWFFRALILLVALLVMFFCFYRINKRKLKKPLVVTGRVKRLVVLFLIIYFLCLLLVLIKLKTGIGILVFITINAASFFVLIFANVLILPFEKLIQLNYILKAKKKLKMYKHLKVIAITGSYGKTSTKNFLFEMLSEKFCVLKSPQSFNTAMGITKTILDYLKPHHQILILEMGADHKNDIKKLCKIVSPDVCVVTAVGKQHLKTFKNFITKTQN